MEKKLVGVGETWVMAGVLLAWCGRVLALEHDGSITRPSDTGVLRSM